MTMTPPTIFVDIDHTLIDQDEVTNGSAPEPGRIVASVWGNTYHVSVRPSAESFLQQLTERGYRLCALTTGQSIPQGLLLEAVGLRKYFEAVYGWDTRNEIPVPERWMLVDDANPVHNQHKLQWLKFAPVPQAGSNDWNNAVGRVYLRCKAFHADEEEQQQLTRFIRFIEHRMPI